MCKFTHNLFVPVFLFKCACIFHGVYVICNCCWLHGSASFFTRQKRTWHVPRGFTARVSRWKRYTSDCAAACVVISSWPLHSPPSLLANALDSFRCMPLILFRRSHFSSWRGAHMPKLFRRGSAGWRWRSVGWLVHLSDPNLLISKR